MMINFDNFKNIFGVFASLIAVVIAVASFFVSLQSLKVSEAQVSYDKNISSLRLIIETLKEMKEVQDELRTIRAKISGRDNLIEKEILLLNYYEVLSKTLAENKNMHPNLFNWAQCTYESSVRLRRKPSQGSEQISGVQKEDWVVVLGTFSYNDEDIWYYVIAPDKNIGWAYKHFKFPK